MLSVEPPSQAVSRVIDGDFKPSPGEIASPIPSLGTPQAELPFGAQLSGVEIGAVGSASHLSNAGIAGNVGTSSADDVVPGSALPVPEDHGSSTTDPSLPPLSLQIGGANSSGNMPPSRRGSALLGVSDIGKGPSRPSSPRICVPIPSVHGAAPEVVVVQEDEKSKVTGVPSVTALSEALATATSRNASRAASPRGPPAEGQGVPNLAIGELEKAAESKGALAGESMGVGASGDGAGALGAQSGGAVEPVPAMSGAAGTSALDARRQSTVLDTRRQSTVLDARRQSAVLDARRQSTVLDARRQSVSAAKALAFPSLQATDTANGEGNGAVSVGALADGVSEGATEGVAQGGNGAAVGDQHGSESQYSDSGSSLATDDVDLVPRVHDSERLGAMRGSETSSSSVVVDTFQKLFEQPDGAQIFGGTEVHAVGADDDMSRSDSGASYSYTATTSSVSMDSVEYRLMVVFRRKQNVFRRWYTLASEQAQMRARQRWAIGAAAEFRRRKLLVLGIKLLRYAVVREDKLLELAGMFRARMLWTRGMVAFTDHAVARRVLRANLERALKHWAWFTVRRAFRAFRAHIVSSRLVLCEPEGTRALCAMLRRSYHMDLDSELGVELVKADPHDPISWTPNVARVFSVMKPMKRVRLMHNLMKMQTTDMQDAFNRLRMWMEKVRGVRRVQLRHVATWALRRWHHRASVLVEDERKVDLVVAQRSLRIVRQCFRSWSARSRHLMELNAVGDARLRNHEVAYLWHCILNPWRHAAMGRVKWRRAVTHHAIHQQRTALQSWLIYNVKRVAVKLRVAKAESFWSDKAERQFFAMWKGQWKLIEYVEEMEQIADDHDDKRIVKSSFRTWQHELLRRCECHADEKKALDFYIDGIERQAWAKWVDACKMSIAERHEKHKLLKRGWVQGFKVYHRRKLHSQRLAKKGHRFFLDHVLKGYFSHWAHYKHQLRIGRHLFKVVQQKRHFLMTQEALDHWRTAAIIVKHERVVKYEQMAQWHLKRTFHAMQNHAKKVKLLKRLRRSGENVAKTQCKRWAYKAWRQHLRALRMARVEKEGGRLRMMRRTMKHWRLAISRRKVRDEGVVALKARVENREMHEAFLEWRNTYEITLAHTERLARIAKRGELRLVKAAFIRWNTVWTEVVKARDMEKHADDWCVRRLLVGALNKWDVICKDHLAVKARDLAVVKFRDASLKRRWLLALKHFVNDLNRLRQASERAVSHHDEYRVRAIFRVWRSFVRIKKRLMKRVNDFAERRTKHHDQRIVNGWHFVAHRQARLKRLEAKHLRRQHSITMAKTFQLWRAQLAAVQKRSAEREALIDFRVRWIQRHAFKTYRDVYTRRILLRQYFINREDKLVVDMLDLWKQRFLAHKRHRAFVRVRDMRTKRYVLQRLQKHAKAAICIRDLSARCRNRISREIRAIFLRQWRDKLMLVCRVRYLKAQAVEHDRKKIESAVWARWKTRYAENMRLHDDMKQVAIFQDRFTVKRAWSIWFTNYGLTSRLRIMGDGADQFGRKCLRSRYMDLWRQKLMEVKTYRTMLTEYQLVLCAGMQKRVLFAWREHVVTIHARRAGLLTLLRYYHRSLLFAPYNSWRAAVRTTRMIGQVETMVTSNTLRQRFRQWRSEFMISTEVRRCCKRRDAFAMRSFFNKWREQYKMVVALQSIRDANNRTADTFHRLTTMSRALEWLKWNAKWSKLVRRVNLARKKVALQAWDEYVQKRVVIGGRKAAASEKYAELLVRHYFKDWRVRYQLMCSVRVFALQQQAGRLRAAGSVTLRAWYHYTKLHENARAYEAASQHQLVTDAMSHWVKRTQAVQKMTALADQVVAMREEKQVRACMSTWAHETWRVACIVQVRKRREIRQLYGVLSALRLNVARSAALRARIESVRRVYLKMKDDEERAGIAAAAHMAAQRMMAGPPVMLRCYERLRQYAIFRKEKQKMAREATALHVMQSCRRAIKVWVGRFNEVHNERKIVTHYRHTVLSKSFQGWGTWARARRAEDRANSKAVHHWRERVASRVWTSWMERVEAARERGNAADVFFGRVRICQALVAFRSWRAYAAHRGRISAMERRADAFLMRRRVGWTVRHWAAAAEMSLLVSVCHNQLDGVRRRRLFRAWMLWARARAAVGTAVRIKERSAMMGNLHDRLSRWHAYAHRRREQRERIQYLRDVWRPEQMQRTVINAWGRWAVGRAKRKATCTRMRSKATTALKRASFDRWHDAFAVRSVADDFSRMCSTRAAFATWRQAFIVRDVAHKLDARVDALHRRNLCTRMLWAWAEYVQGLIKNDENERVAERHFAMGASDKHLVAWYEHTAACRSRREAFNDVVKIRQRREMGTMLQVWMSEMSLIDKFRTIRRTRRRKVVKVVMSTWKAFTIHRRSVGERRRQADAFLLRNASRHVFVALKQCIVTVRQMEARADTFEALQVQRRVLTVYRNRLGDARERTHAIAVAEKHCRAMTLRHGWDTLRERLAFERKSTSLNHAANAFFIRQVGGGVLMTWHKIVCTIKLGREGVKGHEILVQKKALSHWRQLYRARVALDMGREANMAIVRRYMARWRMCMKRTNAVRAFVQYREKVGCRGYAFEKWKRVTDRALKEALPAATVAGRRHERVLRDTLRFWYDRMAVERDVRMSSEAILEKERLRTRVVLTEIVTEWFRVAHRRHLARDGEDQVVRHARLQIALNRLRKRTKASGHERRGLRKAILHRANRMRRRALRVWVSRVRQRERVYRIGRIVCDRVFLRAQRAAFDMWRQRMAERRITRAKKKVVEGKKLKMLRSGLDRWREQYRGMMLRRFEGKKRAILLRTWQNAAVENRNERETLDTAAAWHRRSVKARFYTVWKHHAAAQKKEREQAQLAVLQRKVVALCVRVRSRQLREMLSAWRRHACGTAGARRLFTLRAVRMAQTVMYAWRIYARHSVQAREDREAAVGVYFSNLVRRSLRRWRVFVAEQRAETIAKLTRMSQEARRQEQEDREAAEVQRVATALRAGSAYAEEQVRLARLESQRIAMLDSVATSGASGHESFLREFETRGPDLE